MGRLLNIIRDILERKILTADERMNMISCLQFRFDKLKKETGVLSGALPAEMGIGPDIDLKITMSKSRIRQKKTAKRNKWKK